MRYQFPESDFVIQVANRSDNTPQPFDWTDRGDGVLWCAHYFNGAPGYIVTAWLPGNSTLEIDAPGLVLDERLSSFNNGIRIAHFVPEPAINKT